MSSSNNDAFSNDEINSSEGIPELIWHGGTNERNDETCDEDSVPELIEKEESNWDSDSERSDDDSNPYETDWCEACKMVLVPRHDGEWCDQCKPENVTHMHAKCPYASMHDDHNSVPDLIKKDDETYAINRCTTLTHETEPNDEKSKPTVLADRLCNLAFEIALAGCSWTPKEMKLTVNTWFGDSAASAHMCNDDTGMYNCKMINEEIKVGSGKAIVATKVGKLKVRIAQTNGQVAVVTLSNVKYVPGLWCNLFSLTAALDKGFNLGNQGRIITLSKGGAMIGFDRVFPTNTGFIMAVEMTPVEMNGGFAVLEQGRISISIHFMKCMDILEKIYFATQQKGTI